MEWAIAVSTLASLLSLSTIQSCKGRVKMTGHLCTKSSVAAGMLVLFAKWLIIYNSSIRGNSQ